MPYFVMTCEGTYPSAALSKGPDLKQAPWFRGRTITAPVPEPLVYELDPARPGNLRAMYDDEPFPLMRDDLVEALRSAGVDNLQLFAAMIRDPNSDAEHGNYKAFNVLGLVAAADMQGSVLMGTSDSRLIDADFESLSVDERRASGLHLFRLAESVSALLVDAAVKEEVERRAIPGMVFYDPADWSG